VASRDVESYAAGPSGPSSTVLWAAMVKEVNEKLEQTADTLLGQVHGCVSAELG
jgi:hypothetical protein